MSAVFTIGILGAGTMGIGIARAALISPAARVVLCDHYERALVGARDRIRAAHRRATADRRIEATEGERRDLALRLSRDYSDLSECELIIEAVPERLDVKLGVLEQVAAVASPTAIIASNTSSLSITRLAGAVSRPDAFVGMHFFNPVPKTKLVEIVRTPFTTDDTDERVCKLVVEHFRKRPLVVGDRPGFVVNALLVPFLLAAARMLDSGYATPEQIDEALQLGAGHPLGPLALCDLIGLDVLCDIGDAMYEQSRDSALVIPVVLRRLVEARHTGRKSGRGFYQYVVTTD